MTGHARNTLVDMARDEHPIERAQVWRHVISKRESVILSTPEPGEVGDRNVIHRSLRRVRWDSEDHFRRSHTFTGEIRPI